MNNSQCVDACQGFFKTKKDRDTFISKKRYLNVTQDGRSCTGARVAEKLGSDENFKPEHTLFCRELRFVAIYTLFGDLWAKKVPFGSKTVFLGQEVHYFMVYIAYFTELGLQMCDYAQKRRCLEFEGLMGAF